MFSPRPRHLLCVAAFVYCATIICGCRIKPRILLHNNTDSRLEVAADVQRHSIGPHESAMFIYPVDSGKVHVMSSAQSWSYELPLVSREMHDDDVVARVQVQPDGMLLVVRPGTSFPVVDDAPDCILMRVQPQQAQVISIP